MNLLKIIIAMTFFVSCQSVPRIPNAFLEDMQILPLDKGAVAYVFANVQEARTILDKFPIEELNDPQAKQMFDRTDQAVAALFPEESGKRFQLVMWGNYPNSRARTAFTFNRSWKRQRSASGQNYWFSASNGLSLSINPRQAFLAASENNEPIDPFVTGAEIPEDFNSFRRGVMGFTESPFSCWLENPSPMLSRSLNEAGIPIRFPVQQLFFNLYTTPSGEYEAVIRLVFNNTSQARGMAGILNLAGNFVSNDPDSVIAAIFLAYPSVYNNRSLDIKTALLSEREVTLLLEMFLL
jgi:hypothetical protein